MAQSFQLSNDRIEKMDIRWMPYGKNNLQVNNPLFAAGSFDHDIVKGFPEIDDLCDCAVFQE